MQTDARVTVKVEGVELVQHAQEDVEDAELVARIAWTKPASPPERGILYVHQTKENHRSQDKCLRFNNGRIDRLLPHLRTAPECPPIEGTGDNRVTSEPNLGNILNGGVEVFEGATIIEVSEEARWLDGVVSGTRYSEVVCGGDWGDHSMR